MAVQSVRIKIKHGNTETTIRCDEKGETLDYWIHRKLLITKEDLSRLIRDYGGKFNLDKNGERGA